MLKLFASDLDGTLLQENNHILAEDKRALNELAEHQVELAIATGRADNEIKEIYKLVKQIGHRISQNGSFVYNKQNEIIHTSVFPNEVSKILYELIEEEQVDYLVSTADDIFIKELTPFMKKFEHLFFIPLKIENNFSFEIGQSILPSKFMIVGETEKIVFVQTAIHKRLDVAIDSYLSDKRCVDVVPKGINKGMGLTKLIKTLAIQPEEIAVIGDSFNDISMLQMTPHSYAISSAHPDVKKHASKVVDYVHEAISDLKRQELY
ncbi:HAD family hydrolase [Paraliobacillus zengyii]|uniref:HAD family hydrolase n=1 Tax=Paraliobacillus zengyii TaxID=2213194 RepID=UPI000E3B6A3B|nr:HAD family hydrolase [Paraliobacillus zengyii]